MGRSFHAAEGLSTKKSKYPTLKTTSKKGLWLLLLLLVAALALARWKLGSNLEPKQLIAILREVGTHPGSVPLFLLLYLVGTSLLLPAIGFAIVAAVVWGYGPGLLVTTLALNLVSNLHFGFGRWLGRTRVEAWLDQRGWRNAALDGNGITTMIAIRQLPLPFLGVNVAAGASPIKWWHFLIGSGIGALPPTLVYTWFATALIDGVEGARTEALIKALTGGAAVLLLAVAPKLWQRWRKSKA